MTRYIDADEIPYREIWKEEWLKNAGKFQQGVFKDEIDEMPTVDAVPVIRCKDCKYWLPHEQFGFDADNDEYHNYCGRLVPDDDYYAYTREADEYCSRAERKDNGADKRRR